MNIESTYTNCSTLVSAVKANNQAFHKRLQQLYPCVDDVTKLPQNWSPDTKAAPLGLTNDNLGCYFRGVNGREDDDKSAAAVRTDQYIPPSCLLYYFEIKIISKGREGKMGLGLTSAQALLSKQPGWTRESYGYHGDDGNKFNGDCRGNPYGPTFTTGDVIGCGLNLVEGTCFFTKNGNKIGDAFDEIPSNIRLYPTIGLKTPSEEIKANFGQKPFLYDIEQDLRSLRKNMTLTISNYPITDFGNWQNTLHKLVQSWLLQNSYPKTADSFTKSAKIECKEDLHRIQQRNRIQQLVLSGRISEAIKLTNCLCPNLLQNNPNLLFALKCRQFIELISGAENDYQPIFNYVSEQGQANNNGTNSNGVVKMESNGDQPDKLATSAISNTSLHSSARNGCNGMVVGGDKTTAEDRQSTSSASLQELMDIDRPMAVPASSISSNNESHHRNSTQAATNLASSNNYNNGNSSSSNNHPVSTNKTESTNQSIDEDFEINEQKYAKLLQFGRELSEYLQQLDKIYGKNEVNEKMLHDAIGLIAFTNPRTSCLGKLLDPIEREPISQLLNSSIVKAEMGDSYRPPLEEVVNHLRKLVKLNDSHGRWLVDRLY